MSLFSKLFCLCFIPTDRIHQLSHIRTTEANMFHVQTFRSCLEPLIQVIYLLVGGAQQGVKTSLQACQPALASIFFFFILVSIWFLHHVTSYHVLLFNLCFRRHFGNKTRRLFKTPCVDKQRFLLPLQRTGTLHQNYCAFPESVLKTRTYNDSHIKFKHKIDVFLPSFGFFSLQHVDAV